jgi:hypothetical protein
VDVIRGKGAWVLLRTSTMRVSIRVLVCDFLKLLCGRRGPIPGGPLCDILVLGVCSVELYQDVR